MDRKCFKSIILTVILALFAGSLAACSGGAGSRDAAAAPDNRQEAGSEPAGTVQSPAKTVELKYYGWNDEKSYLEPAVEAFNAQSSNIKVTSTFMVPEDYYVKALTMISSGNADFDLYSVNGIDKLNQYQQVKGLVDLTPLIKDKNIDVSKYGPSIQSLKVEDKYYALPYRTSCYAIFYNKDIFDKAGIPYPENLTWEEYAAIALKLTTGSGQDKVWGGFIADWIRAPFMTVQKDSNLLDDDMSTITCWLEYLNRLYNVDKSHMSFAEMKTTKTDWIKIFESGKVAMLPNGEWTVSMLNADKAAGNHNINWDIASLPVINKGDTVKSLGGVSTFMGIYSGSKNTQAAFDFIDFVCGEKGAKLLAEKGVLTAFVNDEVKKAFKASAGVSGADALLTPETYTEAQPIPQMAAVFQAYDEEKELYLTKQESIGEFSKNFAAKRENALKD